MTGSPKRIYRVQGNSPNEINNILAQIMERFDDLEGSESLTNLTEAGTFFMFDWEEPHGAALV